MRQVTSGEVHGAVLIDRLDEVLRALVDLEGAELLDLVRVLVKLVVLVAEAEVARLYVALGVIGLLLGKVKNWDFVGLSKSRKRVNLIIFYV